ncbi:MOSC domain-containing protein [Pseudonocardia sp. C8]|uniref:MOSC domain-containing protein n=1 Tax=Pseudonocardia sp. C8 TaxID=2762759 RepID=UPI001642F75F|nr:MOSC N-terminal beta barrel domain-containing protein [Pseudonocardia sp. C8]MBC3191254.1 MOSC domain-containing protein [Pseudonocardia sp. C8]
MTVVSLHRYPVKSMLGESVERSVVTGRGLLGDRALAVYDVESGTVASAKVPRLWAGLLGFSARFAAEPEPGRPLPEVEIRFPDGSMLRSDDAGVDIALSTVLGREVRLVAEPPEGSQFEEVWPEFEDLPVGELAPEQLIEGTTARREESGERVSRFDVSAFGAPGTFFDLSTLHVLTESTLDRLRELAPEVTFDVRRYRPNVVLDGTGTGFVENDWPGSVGTIGSTGVRYSFATMRCVMTTLAQGDLPRDAGVLRTVAKHNRIEIPQVGGVWACAGVYADVTADGEIAVGDGHSTPTPP